MPKRPANSKRIEKFSGTTFFTMVSASTAGQLNMIPSQANWGTRLNGMAENFQFFRFTRLKFQFLPLAATGHTVLGVAMGVADVAPASTSNVAQCEYSAINFQPMTIPTKLVVPQKFLLSGQIKWYKTEAGAAADQFEVQGQIFMATSVSDTVQLWIDYDIEFSDWLPPSSTPKLSVDEIKNQAIMEYRAKVLSLGDTD